MSIFTLASLLAAATGGPIEHRVAVAHRGGEIAALYRADVEIATRNRGAVSPRGQGARQCHWTATLNITRRLEGAPQTERQIGSERVLSGARSGDCTAAAGAIRADIAARGATVREQLIAAAEADRGVLVAELEAAQPRG
jgi:hypothetical protein